MTKVDIERFIKRYKYVKMLIKNKQPKISFYIGKRKKEIVFSEELRMLYETVEDVYAHIREGWVKELIGDILKGKSDVRLLHTYPCGRGMYYSIKQEFIETIYRCCIAKKMVTYEEFIRIGRFQ